MKLFKNALPTSLSVERFTSNIISVLNTMAPESSTLAPLILELASARTSSSTMALFTPTSLSS